jgi:hypothetical protein
MKQRKKFPALLLTVALLFTLVFPVSAADGQVTYSGASKKFIFLPGSTHSPTDLFPELKNVMPGDTLTQTITVRNDPSNKVKVKIYIRSLGARDGSDALLSQLHLRVEKTGSTQMHYMFDAAANEPAQLQEWVELGTLYSGGTVDLKVILDVPAELGNEFSNQAAYLDWQFLVEEYPIEPDDPVPPTGDIAPVELLTGLAAVSGTALVLVFVVIASKRRKKAEENL